MNKFIFISAIVCLMSCNSSPKTNEDHAASNPAAVESSVEDQLLKLENDYAHALVKHDTAFFRKLLAPGFIYTENDSIYSRETVLNGLASVKNIVKDAHNEDMQVHLSGSTAVVTGWLMVIGSDGEENYFHKYRFTDTWIKSNDEWKIFAAQDYLAH